MSETKQANKKVNNSEDKGSRLRKPSVFILILVIFLIIMAPLYYIYQQQPSKQAALEKELAATQKLISSSTTRITTVQAEISQAEKDIKAAMESYADLDSAPDILEEMLQLAKADGIEVSSTKISIEKEVFTKDKQKTEYPVLSMELGFRGQVPKFQNFLLDLHTKFPTSKIKTVKIDVAQSEKELDRAAITIDIYCLDRSK
jgi:septal ring factor EnvC (AmiA/AmiB activator)